jgi:hypothetical protein
MNTRTLAGGTALAATLQLTALNAYADKVWLESDSTIVKQFAVTPGYPNKESWLFKMTMLTDNDGGIATFGFSLLQAIPRRVVVVRVYETPLPGTPTVVLAWPWPTVRCAPRSPADADRPRRPRFSRRPGASRMLRRKRNGTVPAVYGMRRDSQMPPPPRMSATTAGRMNHVTT